MRLLQYLMIIIGASPLLVHGARAHLAMVYMLRPSASHFVFVQQWCPAGRYWAAPRATTSARVVGEVTWIIGWAPLTTGVRGATWRGPQGGVLLRNIGERVTRWKGVGIVDAAHRGGAMRQGGRPLSSLLTVGVRAGAPHRGG
uniref:Uncharacterized protein n=1 Tax=Cacopsylla melanoneura TaxID=428564 RepID=A0A8D8PR25_9HEMI